MFTKLWTSHELNNAFCTENELKCCMGLTLLSERLGGFWLCESLDSLLPISRWITAPVLECPIDNSVLLEAFTLYKRSVPFTQKSMGKNEMKKKA